MHCSIIVVFQQFLIVFSSRLDPRQVEFFFYYWYDHLNEAVKRDGWDIVQYEIGALNLFIDVSLGSGKHYANIPPMDTENSKIPVGSSPPLRRTTTSVIVYGCSSNVTAVKTEQCNVQSIIAGTKFTGNTQNPLSLVTQRSFLLVAKVFAVFIT